MLTVISPTPQNPRKLHNSIVMLNGLEAPASSEGGIVTSVVSNVEFIRKLRMDWDVRPLTDTLKRAQLLPPWLYEPSTLTVTKVQGPAVAVAGRTTTGISAVVGGCTIKTDSTAAAADKHTAAAKDPHADQKVCPRRTI